MSQVLSASQISTWLLCKRRWFFQSHMKLHQEEKESPMAGSLVHKRLENYLVYGTPIDRAERFGKDYNVGACATAMARKLPAAGSVPRERVESHFVIEPDGVKIQGYRDLIDHGLVVDHKTTSSLKWAKSSKDLQTDVQAIIYAVSMFEENRAGGYVECRWNYGQIKGPAKTLISQHTFAEDGAFDGYYEHVHPYALEILKAKELPAEETAAQELAPTLSACDTLGGCPFKAQCKRPLKSLNGKKRLPMVMSKEEALAMLRSRRKGVNPEPVARGESKTEIKIDESPIVSEVLDEVVATVPGSPNDVLLADKPEVGETVVANAQEIVDAEPPAEAKKRGRSKKFPELETGFTLYIGCQPTKASTTYLHDIIPAIAAEVEQVNGVQHWSLMEYGAGKGALAAAVRTYLVKNPLTGAVVVKFPHLPETQAVLGELVHIASEVVL